jgi:hypothetical protein
MSRATANPSALRDLRFEVLHNHTGKFLIAVCNGPRERTELIRRLRARTSNRGKKPAVIDVVSAKSDIFRTLMDASRGGAAEALHLVNLEKLGHDSLNSLLHELNLRRDVLMKFGVPIIIWIPESLLPPLTSAAPDLWSRRSSVYYFAQSPIKKLLSRLFSHISPEAEKWAPEPVLSDAFETIFSSERGLNNCLANKRAFSLPKMDSLILRIKSGVERLVGESGKGRQLEITLWLWNLNHLDADLENFLDRLDTEQRNLYESLYTDRNEALLYLSERLPKLLNRYLSTLDDRIRKKQPISLLNSFGEAADTQIDRMARSLALREVAVPLTPEADDVDAVDIAWADEGARESLFFQKAASDLESWLAGLTDVRPVYFSPSEGEILKSLYMNPGAAADIGKKMGWSAADLEEKLSEVQAKVRAFLGATGQSFPRPGISSGESP